MVWDLFMSVPEAYLVSSKRIMVCTSGNSHEISPTYKMLCAKARLLHLRWTESWCLRVWTPIRQRNCERKRCRWCRPDQLRANDHRQKNSSWDRIIAVVAWAKPGNLMRALLPGPGAYTIRGKFDGRRHSIDFTKQCPLGSPWLAHVLHFVAHIGKLQSQHVRFRKMQW